jgi:RNA polymerase sigma-54 factor
MKQSIQLRLGQHLTMTPQLQQAIRLLQLSTLELREEIQEALDSNLMLENAEEAERLAEDASERPILDAGHEGAQADRETVSEERLDREFTPDDSAIPNDLPVDSEWTDHFDGHVPGGGGEEGDFDIFAQQSRPETLQDFLHWQLNLSRLDSTELAIATTIVDAIDADGYLGLSCEELLDILGDERLTLAEIETVLHRIQALDPPGVGARDLAECLLIQLRQHPEPATATRDAIAICEHCFTALSRNDLERIQRQLDLTPEAIAAAILEIRGLQPRPGNLIAETKSEYVIPDVFVRRKEGGWVVELNPEITPRLRVNADYAKLIRRADQSDTNAFLRNHLQEARWFIKSLMSRNDTVLRVATKIVEMQRDFLEQGEEAMKSLVLRDVADALELHESTVSRVTTQKFMHTPRGTYEFKYFFSSHVNTAEGGECSSVAIRAHIRKLVSAEPPSKPLSDQRIATILGDRGINVARRTVAKYRENMGIAASSERRRLR